MFAWVVCEEDIMGWKTDWLYGLIFDLIRDVWKRALREADAFGESKNVDWTPPERLHVQQFSEAELSDPHCTGMVKRSWIYDGNRFEEQIGPGNDSGVVERRTHSGSKDKSPLSSVFNAQGIVQF